MKAKYEDSNSKIIQMRLISILLSFVTILVVPSAATAQTCVTPPAWYETLPDGGSYPSAYPRPGWKYQFNTQWVTMSGGSSVPFIFCNTNINASNCVYFGAGDSLFDASRKNAIRGAFSTWNSANTDTGGNNAGFMFYEGSSSSFTAGVYWEVRSVNSSGMNGAVGLTGGIFVPVDSNNDGFADTKRRHVMSTDIIATATNSTFLWNLMAHEIGHGMALDDCYGCGKYATIMHNGTGSLNDPDPLQLTGPTTCDNQRTRNTAFP